METSVSWQCLAALLLAFSCGKSETDGSKHGAGGSSGGSAGGGTSVAGGSGAGSGGAGQMAGDGGTSSGRGGAGGGTAGTGVGGAAGTGTAGTSAGEAGASGADGSGPTTMLVLFDRSWLMNECGDGTETVETSNALTCAGVTRWQITSSAFVEFVQDPASAGLNMALRFFPDDRPAAGCAGYATNATDYDPTLPSCDIEACSQPLVAAAPLSADGAPTDTQEAAIVAAVTGSTPPPGDMMPSPNPQAPTYAALAGAEQWATSYASAHPSEPTLVVLITDGEPRGCDTSISSIARLAADANSSAGVLTYVVGLGQSSANVYQIAMGGGTEAYPFPESSTAANDILAALVDIRDRAR